jgi:hypothetical protein
MSSDPRPTRRALLLGAVAALASACRPRRSPRAVAPRATDAAALQSAREVELDIVSTYSAAMRVAGPSAQALLRPLLDDHQRHLAALGRGTARAGGFTPGNSRDLAAAERRTVASLVRAASSARDGRTTALLASIAASHRAHLAHLDRKPFHW